MSLLAPMSNRKRLFNRHCQECCVSEKCVLFPERARYYRLHQVYIQAHSMLKQLSILNEEVNQNKLKKYLKNDFQIAYLLVYLSYTIL